MHRSLAAMVTALLIAGNTVAAEVPDAARAELAPNGTLRAGMNLDNTQFTRRDAVSGELYGVSVDIMRELAARLGVPLEFVVHNTPGQVADSAQQGTWDVALLAIEESRAEIVDFSLPLTEMEATYAVRKDAQLQSVEQVDAAGVRIAAPDRAGYERYLTRTLRNATLVRTQNIPASVDLFNAQGADALAGLRPILLEAMDRMPDARLLDGRFMTVNHGLGVPRGRDAAAVYLDIFVQELIASGFVARAIERHAVSGLAAAALNPLPGRYFAVTESEWTVELEIAADGAATFTHSSWEAQNRAAAKTTVVKARWQVQDGLLMLTLVDAEPGTSLSYEITTCLAYSAFGGQGCSFGLKPLSGTGAPGYGQALWHAENFEDVEE